MLTTFLPLVPVLTALISSFLIGVCCTSLYLVRRRRWKKAAAHWEQNYLKQKDLLAAMVFAEEGERQRLARKVHDEVGTMLSAARCQMVHMFGERERETASQPLLSSNVELLDEIIQNTRQIRRELVPAVLEDLGLADSLRSLCAKLRESSNVDIRFIEPEFCKRLDYLTEISLYRAVQELINNSLEHASAARIEVVLFQTGQKVHVHVADDGCGISKSRKMAHGRPARKGLGLKNIESRVQLLSGRFELEPGPSGGTVATIELPLLLEEEKFANLFV